MPPRARNRGVAKISQVRTELGFGNSRNPPAQKACKAFLDKYRPSLAMPAHYFTNWQDEVHKREVSIMAEKFLVEEGGGARYWPADGGSSDRPRWGVNPETDEILKTLVAQLLCNLNKKTQKRLTASASENTRREARAGSYRSETVGRSAREPSPISVESDSDEEDSHLFDQEDNPEPPPRISEPSEDPFSPGPNHFHTSPGPSNRTVEMPRHESDMEANSLDRDRIPGAPAAPVAQMTGMDDLIGLTSPRRRRRPVDLQGYLSLSDDDMYLARTPTPSEPAASVRAASLELGVMDYSMSTGAVSEDVPNNEPIGDHLDNASKHILPDPGIGAEEQPLPSTENVTPQPETFAMPTSEAFATPEPEVDEDRRAMPPPPLPLPPRQPIAHVTRREPRYRCKWNIQTAPRNYRLWGLYGTSGPRSMAELLETPAFEGVNSVQFRLEGQGMSWQDAVPKDDEEAFEDMKVRFGDRIKDDLRRLSGTRDSIIYEIIMVPGRYMNCDEAFAR
ncbi:uncharacterized protein FIESC28_01575 [Fusarium coffeatum]|uniref:Uncharacterized protein n=1 Tax=Fusarium coffeatum TaxID=231269 RepID=A0A366S9E9_9HYPO|nr:uncharacterized protein FIESC28_01575 [Fusarium coffeatum]RBR25612.1 hypothetical protein FIESC28_01575 [Fusarium coffeatum]